MPTFEADPRFLRDYERLSQEERDQFKVARVKFVADLQSDRFRSGLRVRGVQGNPGVFEMTWAPDGRATFEYGGSVRNGEPHVIWRRIGTHDIFQEP